MKLNKITGLFFGATLAIALTGCAEAVDSEPAVMDAKPVMLDTDEAKASYGIGYGFASNLKGQTAGLELSTDALIQGITDAMTGAEMSLSDEAIQTAISSLQQKQLEMQQAEAKKLSKAARAEGEAFLAENGTKEGVVTTESGLQYEILVRGNSEERPTEESTVSVHYHGTLVNGTVFDSSVERGEPIDFPLAGVIAGWTEGLQLMAKGDKFRFFIPANLAYGDAQASPIIMPGSTLIFEVELLDIL